MFNDIFDITNAITETVINSGTSSIKKHAKIMAGQGIAEINRRGREGGPHLRTRNIGRPINFENKNKNVNIDNSINNSEMSKYQQISKEHTLAAKHNSGEEVEIIAPPKLVSKIIADYTTIQLPIHGSHTLICSSTNVATTRLTLNDLNSPFAFSATSDYLGTSQWKSLFQYYRILTNDVKVELHNVSWGDNGTDATYDAVSRANESKKIALCCLEFTDSATTRLTNNRKIRETKHCDRTLVKPPIYGSGTSGILKYHYEPKDYIHDFSHIANTADEGKWTGINGTVAHPHYVHIDICAMRNGVITDNIDIHIEVSMMITVQFREVTDNILTTSQTSA